MRACGLWGASHHPAAVGGAVLQGKEGPTAGAEALLLKVSPDLDHSASAPPLHLQWWGDGGGGKGKAE